MNELDSQCRYHRQMIFDRFGREGQQRLSSARITIIGCGGLGSSLAEILTRAGAGFIRLVDADRVELSNLHRQHLYSVSDVGRLKVEAAAETLARIDPEVQIDCVGQMLGADNASDLIAGSDLVLDALDRWSARAILDRACLRSRIPWIFTGVSGSELMTMNIIPGESCCLSCALDPPVDDAPVSGGVLGPSVWVASGLEAMEAMKFFAGGTAAMRKTILAMDLWTGRSRLLAAGKPADDCECGRLIRASKGN